MCKPLTEKNRGDPMAKIEKVEIYFEPQGAYKRMFELGSHINMPFQKAVPKALQTADQILSMDGNLVAYGADKHFEVQVTKEKSDTEWAKFIGTKCTSPGQLWKRWNGETSQGRWNVIVFL
jgi:hypothetical protein